MFPCSQGSQFRRFHLTRSRKCGGPVNKYKYSLIYLNFKIPALPEEPCSGQLLIIKFDCRKLTNQTPTDQKDEKCCLQNWESNKGSVEPNKSEMKKTFCICQLDSWACDARFCPQNSPLTFDKAKWTYTLFLVVIEAVKLPTYNQVIL